ncbi:hypothetical protein HCH_00372 [Hahella chejuensis KCTC 2396]|uniref:Uncharacterized protein n=1 Tax=Hahella chejuensis (strain KCTC 2396) TaxID=349521 RepID=Q2SPZ1_HAHCH|nr:hypothetical protein HCH_00372 [Hahella chejuensis KCTC 2396]
MKVFLMGVFIKSSIERAITMIFIFNNHAIDS